MHLDHNLAFDLNTLECSFAFTIHQHAWQKLYDSPVLLAWGGQKIQCSFAENMPCSNNGWWGANKKNKSLYCQAILLLSVSLSHGACLKLFACDEPTTCILATPPQPHMEWKTSHSPQPDYFCPGIVLCSLRPRSFERDWGLELFH